MQAGFTPGSHMGTPVDTVQQSASGRAWEGSFAQKIYRATLDGVEAYDEREAAYPRFRPTLCGPTYSNPPTGNTSGEVSVILNPFDPEDSMTRPRDYTTFLQPGKPLKEEVHGPDGANWTTSGPISVSRTPSGKFRSEHGASTVARAEQEAAAGRKRRQKLVQDMMARDETPYRRELYQPAAPAPVSAPATAPVPAPATLAAAGSAGSIGSHGLRLVPITVPKAVPTPKQFMEQLGKLLRNEFDAAEAKQFAADNTLNIIIGGLLLLVVVLLIVAIALGCRKTKVVQESFEFPPPPQPSFEFPPPAPYATFGGTRRLTSLLAD